MTLGSGRRFSDHGPGLDTYPPTRFVQVALRWDRDALDRRIAARYRRQLDDGFLEEVRAFLDASPSPTAAQALGYKEFAAHVRGELTLDEAVAEAVDRTRRFARRQERWFRRDPRIHWIDAPADPEVVIDWWDEECTKPADERGDLRQWRVMAERYSKHHGLGNDFLVMLGEALPLDAVDRAIALCDRRTGIGADGVMFGIPQLDGGISMRLLNSDGSPAAVSGNGLRCFAQAVARQRGVPHLELDVSTPAGVRHCSVHATDDPRTIVGTVDMGVVCPGPDPDVADLMEAIGAPVQMVKRWETVTSGTPTWCVRSTIRSPWSSTWQVPPSRPTSRKGPTSTSSP